LEIGVASLEIHGVNCHYADIGRGTPVLLVHAATNHGGQWDQVRAAMGGGYRYLLPDLFNSGNTGPWPLARALNFDDEADIVLALMHAVGEPVHLAGHSYGGAVALRAAVRAGVSGAVASLCLIEPGGCPLLAAAGRRDDYDEYVGVMDDFLGALDRGEPVTAWRDFLNYYRGSPDAWDSLNPDTQNKILAKSESQRQVYAAQMSNPTTLEELGTLDTAALIITGGKSTAPERGVREVLLQYLPNAVRHTIAGAGHPMPATHAGEVAAALSRHIKESSPAP
jgi:pimeloyl-ACP methyl ester carboxylesterase